MNLLQKLPIYYVENFPNSVNGEIIHVSIKQNNRSIVEYLQSVFASDGNQEIILIKEHCTVGLVLKVIHCDLYDELNDPEEHLSVRKMTTKFISRVRLSQVETVNNIDFATHEPYGDVIKDKHKILNLIEQITGDIQRGLGTTTPLPIYNELYCDFEQYIFYIPFVFLWNTFGHQPQYKNLELLVTINDPLERLNLVFENVKEKMQQSAVASSSSNLIPISDKPLPAIQYYDFKKFLKFSPYELLFCREFLDLKKYGAGICDLVIVSNYTLQQFDKYPKYIGIGVLSRILVSNSDLLRIVPQKFVRISKNSKVGDLLFVDTYRTSFIDEKDDTSKQKIYQLIEECVQIVLNILRHKENTSEFLELIDRINYWMVQKQDQYLTNIYCLLVSSAFKDTSLEFLCWGETKSIKDEFQWLFKSLSNLIKNDYPDLINHEDQNSIKFVSFVSDEYLPCIFGGTYSNFVSKFSIEWISEEYSDKNLGTILKLSIPKESSKEVVMINPGEIFTLKNVVATRSTMSTMERVNKESSLLNNHRRVKIDDVVMMNYVLYAKTSTIDENSTDNELEQSLLLYESILPLYRSYDEYESVKSYSAHESSFFNKSDFLHTNSFKISNKLEITYKLYEDKPLWTHKLLKRFEIIKSILKVKKSADDVSEIYNEVTAAKAAEQSSSTKNDLEHRTTNDVTKNLILLGMGKAVDNDGATQVSMLAKRALDMDLEDGVKRLINQKLTIASNLGINSSEYGEHLKYIKLLMNLPWSKYSDTGIVDVDLVKKQLDLNHFGLDEIKDKIIENIVGASYRKDKASQVLCLVGPPGVGKTSIANSIAQALNRKSVSLSLGGIDDISIINGFMSTYTGATPGKILSLITQAEVFDPVIILDEIDKVSKGRSRGENVEYCLLELLDPVQNTKFRDNFFDITFDLSRVMFITTANSLDDISAPLKDRMNIIEIEGYSEEEKVHIAQNHIIPKIINELKETVLSKFNFSTESIKYIIDFYTKEAGVRKLEKLLVDIINKSLVKNGDKLENDSIKITTKIVEEYLGKPKFINTISDRKPKIGISVGLAYTQLGGTIQLVEAIKMPGKGQIELTGHLGDVLKESVKIAMSYVKTNWKKLGISSISKNIKVRNNKSTTNTEEDEIKNLFDRFDVHVHLPEGAISKDGPSAGVTIFVALVSAFTERSIRTDVAMTGEINLSGEILAVGGFKSKLAAAVREGIKTVLIPEANKNNVSKIPQEIRNKLEIILVRDLNGVLSHVLV